MLHSLRFQKMNIISGAINYLSEVRTEMSKVTWPTRAQTVKMTILVISISVVIGVFIGGLDFFLSRIVGILVQR